MVRLLGIELVTFLVLGVTIGALVFMHWNAKRELSALHDDNDRLQKQMLKSSAETKAANYKEKLVQSDLKQLQKKDGANVGRISNLTLQVKSIQKQLDKVTADRQAEQQKLNQLLSQNNEMQGIQDELITDLDETRGKLNKCEGAKNSAVKAGLSKANFSNKKKVMELERGNRELTAQLELARAQIQDAKGRLETCERLQKRDNIAFQD